MIKLALVGYTGNMGQVITNLCTESEDVAIVCGIDINHSPRVFPVFDELAGFSGAADVLIDFSHPAMLPRYLPTAIERGLACVVATTGLTKEHQSLLKDASAHIPIFFSANMSLGVNLLIDLVTRAFQFLNNDYDIEIIERHHNQKIDAPSGTALAIADAINNISAHEYVFDRHSERKKRSKGEIGLHAVRGGTVVGEHTVLFAGLDEIIEIKHAAASKEVFATGSLKAARFIHGKPPGLYNMKSMLEDV